MKSQAVIPAFTGMTFADVSPVVYYQLYQPLSKRLSDLIRVKGFIDFNYY